MNRDFWNKILLDGRNIPRKVLTLILDFYKNKFLPFSKKALHFVKEFSITVSKKIYNRSLDFYKNKFLPFSKKALHFVKEFSITVSKKIYNRSLEFYKNKFLPFLKKLVALTKEFLNLISINAKTDNREFLKTVLDAFLGIILYIKEAGNKIKVLFSSRNDFINHIRFLSYKRLIIFSLAFVTLDVFLIWFGTYRILYAKHYWEGTQDKKFFIRPGKNLDDIIGELKQNDILKSKLIFKIYVKVSGKENLIISKRYLISNGISNSELLNILTDKNMVQTEKFTVIEGLRIKQIAKIAEIKLQLSQDLFIKETENDSLINILGLKGKIQNLEGFLFPDTYYLPLDVDEKGLVNILFNEFRKKVLINEEISDSIENKNKNLLNVIVLASIIQGETNLKDEMKTISGVYHNRLRKKMKLEADPTIQYILPDGPKPKLKFSDLKIDSPYNTYKYFGLPPGPINNPGLYAIKASINPEKNNFIFFVATGNGGHKFSETYQEHLKAIEEYKKNTEKKSEQ